MSPTYPASRANPTLVQSQQTSSSGIQQTSIGFGYSVYTSDRPNGWHFHTDRYTNGWVMPYSRKQLGNNPPKHWRGKRQALPLLEFNPHSIASSWKHVFIILALKKVISFAWISSPSTKGSTASYTTLIFIPCPIILISCQMGYLARTLCQSSTKMLTTTTNS